MAELISQQWFAALARYVEGLQQETLRAAENAVEFLQESVQERARTDVGGWSELADDITVWSEDGQLVIGVNNLEMVSQAFALEYGDEVRPPNALFRTLGPDVRQATQHMAGQMNMAGFRVKGIQ